MFMFIWLFTQAPAKQNYRKFFGLEIVSQNFLMFHLYYVSLSYIILFYIIIHYNILLYLIVLSYHI